MSHTAVLGFGSRNVLLFFRIIINFSIKIAKDPEVIDVGIFLKYDFGENNLGAGNLI